MRSTLLLAVATLALVCAASARPSVRHGALQPLGAHPLDKVLFRSMLQTAHEHTLAAAAQARASASVMGPWFAEVSFAGDAARTFKDFTLNDDETKALLDSVKETNPHRVWAGMTWARAKAAGGQELKDFKDFRAKFVQAVTYTVHKILDPCPYCKVQGSGSEDPASDIDLAVTGWGANVFIRAFNTMFEQLWPGGATAAEIFDVNLYGDCWVWPQSGNVNLHDEVNRDEIAKAASRVNLMTDRATVNKAGKALRKVPLCFWLSKLNTELVYVYTIPKSNSAVTNAEAMVTNEREQREWALVHWITYILAEVEHHTHPTPLACSLHPSAADMLAHCDAIKRRLRAEHTDADRNFNRDFRAAVARFLAVVQEPCMPRGATAWDPPPDDGTRYCEAIPANCPVGQCERAVKMEVIKGRNILNFNALDRLFDAIDPAKPASKAAFDHDPTQYCLQTKNKMSVAAFYSQEAYLTKGAINHVVHSGQAGAAIDWISRSEFFDSFLENLGDFQKEVAHTNWAPHMNALPPAQTAAAEAFATKASKYVSRLFDSHHRIKTRGADGAKISGDAQSFASCAFPPIFVLQKQVRNKVSTLAILAAQSCAYSAIFECVKTYLRPAPEPSVMAPSLLATAVESFAREVHSLFYSTYVAGEPNNGALALDKDPALFHPSSCTIAP